MAIISQIWVQHRHCEQIIGHCHLRVGSGLEPELGGALFSVLNLALREVENTSMSGLSGLYGFQFPNIDGIGLFSTQNEHFRVYFLCEGLYTGSIPYLAGNKLMSQVKKLFHTLNQIIPDKQAVKRHNLLILIEICHNFYPVLFLLYLFANRLKIHLNLCLYN